MIIAVWGMRVCGNSSMGMRVCGNSSMGYVIIAVCRVSFRIFGKGGKCRVGAEEGGMLAALTWPLEGGLGILPQKILKFSEIAFHAI